MSSSSVSVSAGSSNDAILAHREDIDANISMSAKQSIQQQYPAGGAGGGGGGTSGIEIYIHSPTTTTSSTGGDDRDGNGNSNGASSKQMEIQNRAAMAQLYNRPKTFRKLSNSSSIISEIFRQPSDDISEQRLRVKIKRANERDNSKDLIEFLRTTSPPPPRGQSRLSFSLNPYGNRLSSSSSYSGGRKTARIPFWAVCRRLKARRGGQQTQTKRRKLVSEKEKAAGVLPDPPLLRLPDSAVAGRTIGGHRHIAISIPIEHDHLGDESSQAGAATSTGVAGRPISSSSISADRVPPRTSSAVSKTASGSKKQPQPITRSHTSGGSSLPLRRAEDGRPKTADPLGSHRSTMVSFDSHSPQLNHHDSAMEMHYPAVRNQHSFGYTNTIGIHESPDGVSVRRHHHWSWPAGGQQTTSQSEQTSPLSDNSPEAIFANAMALHGYTSPSFSQHGHGHGHGCCSPVTGMVSELRRGQSMSMLSFPHPHKMGIALTTSNSDLRQQKSMAQLSYHEITHHNHHPHGLAELSSSGSDDDQGGKSPKSHTLKSLTFDIPPAYRATPGVAKSPTPINTSRSNSISRTTTQQQQPDLKESEPQPLRLSSIMTVADVKPSFSSESLSAAARDKDDDDDASSVVLSPQPTRASRIPSVDSSSINTVIQAPSPSLSPLSSSEGEQEQEKEEKEDGESTPKATSTFASRFEREHQPPRPPSSILQHHRPSIEQILYSSPSPNSSSRSPTPRPVPVDMITPPRPIPPPSPTSINTRPAAPTPARARTAGAAARRSESHQALAKQYEALRQTRDKEMTMLLDRLERLENKNDWWLNSVVPMVENMTRRLTRVYDDESLPRLARERARTTENNSINRTRSISRASTTIHKPLALSDDDLEIETSTSYDSFLPPLTLSGPRQPTFAPQSQQPGLRGSADMNINMNRQSLLEPESSLESFDSFNFDRRQYLSQLHNHTNHPFTSVAPPPPASSTYSHSQLGDLEPEPEPSSPYPYPYIYPGESSEAHGRGSDHGNGEEVIEERNPYSLPFVTGGGGNTLVGSRLRYNSSNDSLPRGGFIGIGMGRDMRSSISSTWDHQPDYYRPTPPPLPAPQHNKLPQARQRETSRDYEYNFDSGFEFGHGMGLAVDRLPSRHGEKGLLNTIAIPGGGSGSGSGNNSGKNSGTNTPYSQQPRPSYSSSVRRSTDTQSRSQPMSQSRSQPQPQPQSRPRPRPRPQSMFIPRRVDYQFDNDDDEQDQDDQEYYDEDEDQGGFQDNGSRLFGRGGRREQPTSIGRKSGDERRVNFLEQGTVPVPKTRPISWPSTYRPQTQTQTATRAQQSQAQTQTHTYTQPRVSTHRPGREIKSARQSSDDRNWNYRQHSHHHHHHHHHQQQREQQQQQQRQTEWDTLEPLMRGLMETTRLDLELGRDLDLDLDLDRSSDMGFSEST